VARRSICCLQAAQLLLVLLVLLVLLLLAPVAAYHLALHCLADLRTISEEMRAH
jgi:hypothetical protein